jgi:hypothetical protein
MRHWTHGSCVDRKAHLRATVDPSERDIGWAAGFLEGEGCFHLNAGKYRVAQVDAVQVNRAPLDYLRDRFGGSVGARRGRPNQSSFWVWQVSGARARGVMMTVYALMSPRRQEQIRVALNLPHFELVL